MRRLWWWLLGRCRDCGGALKFAYWYQLGSRDYPESVDECLKCGKHW